MIGKCGEYVSQLIYCHCQKNDIIKKLSINLKNGKSVVVQRVQDFYFKHASKEGIEDNKKTSFERNKIE